MEFTPAFPVKTKIYSTEIQGVHTDFSFSVYVDRLLLIVTQIGSAGTIISASQDSTFDGSTTYSTNVLMGKRDELVSLCARRIVETAGKEGYIKPMVICLGLKEHTPQMLKGIEKMVAENNTWSKPADA